MSWKSLGILAGLFALSFVLAWGLASHYWPSSGVSFSRMNSAVEVGILVNIAFSAFKAVRNFAENRFRRMLDRKFPTSSLVATTDVEFASELRRQFEAKREFEISRYQEEDDDIERVGKYLSAISAFVLFGLLIADGWGNGIAIAHPVEYAALLLTMLNPFVTITMLLAYWSIRGRNIIPALNSFSEGYREAMLGKATDAARKLEASSAGTEDDGAGG